MESGRIDVYIDGTLAATYHDNGPHNHYFKYGVYHQRDMSPQSGVYYKNIHFYAQGQRGSSTQPTTAEAPPAK